MEVAFPPSALMHLTRSDEPDSNSHSAKKKAWLFLFFAPPHLEDFFGERFWAHAFAPPPNSTGWGMYQAAGPSWWEPVT